MKLEPVLFLVGTDRFQKQLFLEDARKEVFPKGSGGLNDERFDVSDRKLSELFDLANTLPMLSSRRLIVIQNVGAPKEEAQDAWIRYLEKPSPDTVIIAMAEKMDKRTKLVKALGKKKALLEMMPPKPRELSGWILRLAKRHDVSISPPAVEELMQSVGADLGRLDQELEKLTLYIYPEKKISPEAVSALVLKSNTENVFAWTDRIVEGRLAGAMETLSHLLEAGEPPLVLVAMLARHLRILLKAGHHLRSGTPRPQLASVLGVPPFLVGRYLEQVRKLNGSEIRKSLGELQRLDRDLKSTGLPPRMLLERSTRSIALRSGLS